MAGQVEQREVSIKKGHVSSLRSLYTWKIGFGGSCISPGTPLWKPRSTACRGRWLAGSTSGETTSGALHSNTSILKTNRCGGWPNGWWEFLHHLPAWLSQGKSLTQTLRKRKPLQTIWRLIFSRWPILWSRQLLRQFTLRWGLNS